MNSSSKIYIAGHRGMVGSAIISKLKTVGFSNIIFRTHEDLDLTVQKDTEEFFNKERPDYVFLAAAKVGGIYANNTYKADFIYQNIMIAANVIHSSYKFGVKKLLNLGSSCIYPKFAPQPLKEEYLLTDLLEPTNEPYAIAKIAAIKLCRYYNEQYGTDFMSVMPTNLYGFNDNYDLENSHVLPAIIRKFHLAKLYQSENYEDIKNDFITYGIRSQKTAGTFTKEDIEEILHRYNISKDSVTLWGSGTPYREFLYADDLADACIFLVQRYNASELNEFVNIGTGIDIRIKDLAALIKGIVGYEGEIKWDASKPDGTPQKLLNVEKMNKLGWTAKTNLGDGISMVYRDYKEKALVSQQ
ncbi:GDP-L-fucose synthase [candidate division WS5 bacterium]|uniref:GDP-L-fucose synthase n=1 Tax=candidate division WS5 bacterium TaxID=2093353 RepID=A0A419DDQ0_9BACT|nr:MAG: GDP-L-fucose synthase [candidate division WS5 bacterium]